MFLHPYRFPKPVKPIESVIHDVLLKVSVGANEAIALNVLDMPVAVTVGLNQAYGAAIVDMDFALIGPEPVIQPGSITTEVPIYLLAGNTAIRATQVTSVPVMAASVANQLSGTSVVEVGLAMAGQTPITPTAPVIFDMPLYLSVGANTAKALQIRDMPLNITSGLNQAIGMTEFILNEVVKGPEPVVVPTP